MSTRRGVGLSAFQNRSSLSTSYASHGAALRSSNLSSLQTQLSVFQSLLHTFALQHGDKIKQNPTFRAEFARMCNAIGVDPLAGSNVTGKGKKNNKGSWWSQILGGDVGDFYYGLAVRVVEVCRASRGENGGLIEVGACRERVGKGRGIGGGIEVSEYVKNFQSAIRMPVTQELTTDFFVVMISYGRSSLLGLLAPASQSSQLEVNK